MTTTDTNAIVIAPFVPPSAPHGPDAGELHELVALDNAVCLSDSGGDHLRQTAEEMLPGWLDQTDRLRRGFIARRGGRLVGALLMGFAAETGSVAGEFDLLIEPGQWGQGIEDALLDVGEAEARALGRTSLQAWSLHPVAEDAEPYVPRTGWGRATRTDLARFLASRGYELEQVERNSGFDLRNSLEIATAAYARAEAAAGDDYRVVAWTLPTPAELRAGFAAILSRLATDVPSGDLVIDEEAWDEGRVLRREARLAAAGSLVSVAAVEHVPSGALVAYNELLIGEDRSGVTHQYGTLVAKEHRGHRLGMLVKAANLLRWRELAPQSPQVSTFNAEENRPMLDINEAIGFVPLSYAAAWQRVLV